MICYVIQICFHTISRKCKLSLMIKEIQMDTEVRTIINTCMKKARNRNPLNAPSVFLATFDKFRQYCLNVTAIFDFGKWCHKSKMVRQGTKYRNSEGDDPLVEGAGLLASWTLAFMIYLYIYITNWLKSFDMPISCENYLSFILQKRIRFSIPLIRFFIVYLCYATILSFFKGDDYFLIRNVKCLHGRTLTVLNCHAVVPG